MNYKISLISSSKSDGGANIAADRIKINLKKNFRVESIYSDKKNLYFKIKYLFARLLVWLFIKDELLLNSLNLFSRLKLEKIQGDILLLNWIGGETISIKNLIKIKKPIIWICHDLWLSTSTEHFLDNIKRKYYLKNFTNNNILKDFIFNQKKILFMKKNMLIICNSEWMKNFFIKSDLTKNTKLHMVYNPIETRFWKGHKKNIAKKKLKFDIKKKYVIFGAHGGLKSFRKGGDLLIESLKHLKNLNTTIEFIVLGGQKNEKKIINNFVFHFRKFTLSKKKQLLYHSVADVTVMPSRAESIPQFAVESLLSKNPVVSYKIGGLEEIIKHKKNGYLAEPFNVKELANGIMYCLKKCRSKDLNLSRKKIAKMFDQKINLAKYTKLVQSQLKS